MNAIRLGRYGNLEFKTTVGNRGTGEIEGVLKLKNGKSITVKLNTKDRESLLSGKVSSNTFFTFERTVRSKQRKGKPLSSKETVAAFKMLAKKYQASAKKGKSYEEISSAMEKIIIPLKTESVYFPNISVSLKVETYEQMKSEEQTRLNQNVSKGNLEHYAEVMKTVLEKAKKSGVSEELIQKTSDLINKVVQEYGEPLDKSKFEASVEAMKKAIKKCLADGNSSEKFPKLYAEALNSNQSVWVKQSREAEYVLESGGIAKFQCETTPAKELGCFSYLGESSGIHGIASMDRESIHVKNLWKTEVKAESGAVLFSALRHGCINKYDKTAMELIAAGIVYQNGSDLDGKGTQENPLSITLSNIQLMTAGRRGMAVLSDGNMPQNQIKTLERLAGKPQPIAVKIPYPDGEQKVFVKVEAPLLFNFGGNMQEYNSAFRVAVKDLDEVNARSMKMLLGENIREGSALSIESENLDKMEEFLKENPNIFPAGSKVGDFLRRDASTEDNNVSLENKKVVFQLAIQIGEMWSKKTYKNGKDPYAIQSRLALLSFKIGLCTTFNCKSGKDRTGVASAEINNLAAEINNNGGIVPRSHEDLDDRRKLNLARMLDGSAAHHITKACTGVEGLKIVKSLGPLSFDGVDHRMGEVRGASKVATS